jgi:hypothetical protein
MGMRGISVARLPFQGPPPPAMMSALPPKADMCSALAHVRYAPIADIKMSKDDIKGSTLLHQWPALLRRCLSTLHPFPLPKQNSLADVHS